MRRLILHIGAHKTGSTSIQKSLFNNRNKLEDVGWKLLHSNSVLNGISQGSMNNLVDFFGVEENFSAKLCVEFEKYFTAGESDLICSCEEMFWINDIDEVSKLHSILSNNFDDIRIIVYLRRQDKHLLSHYQQGFKSPYSTAKRFYGSELTSIPSYKNYFDKYLDYYSKLQLWASFFGKDSLIVRVFDHSKLAGNDVVTDFYQELSLSTPGLNKSHENYSLSKQKVIINHSISEVLPEEWDSFKNIRWSPPKNNKLLSTFKLDVNGAQSILDKYRTSNLSLESTFLKEPSGFLEVSTPSEMKKSIDNIDESDVIDVLGSVLKTINEMSLFEFIMFKLRKAALNILSFFK